ncbi:MAG: hypothetical protein Q6373_018440 [Candidatus Sigynarchaeota archaeon]
MGFVGRGTTGDFTGTGGGGTGLAGGMEGATGAAGGTDGTGGGVGEGILLAGEGFTADPGSFGVFGGKGCTGGNVFTAESVAAASGG